MTFHYRAGRSNRTDRTERAAGAGEAVSKDGGKGEIAAEDGRRDSGGGEGGEGYPYGARLKKRIDGVPNTSYFKHGKQSKKEKKGGYNDADLGK